MQTSNQPIPVPAMNALDAGMKVTALGTIATLDASALGILAAAVKKNGTKASDKVRQFKTFL